MRRHALLLKLALTRTALLQTYDALPYSGTTRGCVLQLHGCSRSGNDVQQMCCKYEAQMSPVDANCRRSSPDAQNAVVRSFPRPGGAARKRRERRRHGYFCFLGDSAYK